jgi:plasmid stability protein
MAIDTSRLVLRLPADLHRRLQERAASHQRSLNGEIVTALRHYVEGVREVHQVWSDDAEEGAAAWEDLAGETLTDEAWEFTADERDTVTRLLDQHREAR